MASFNGDGNPSYKLETCYMTCFRNYSKTKGKFVHDGCCEFGPLGAEGLAALTCVACGCHRDFHERIIMKVPLSPRGGVDVDGGYAHVAVNQVVAPPSPPPAVQPPPPRG